MARIHVEARGRGRAMLLIHGLGSGRVDFSDVADLLAPARRCVLVDLPGHGDAGAAEGGSPAHYAADLVDLARREAPLDVVGLSFGALVALELWHLAPEAVAGVALLDPPLDAEPLLTWARRVSGRDGMPVDPLRAFYRERDLEALMAVMRRHPLTGDLAAAPLRRNAEAHLAADPDAALSTLRALRTYELPPRRPPGSAARAVVVRATRGIVCPADAAAQLGKDLEADVIAIDSGHCMSLSEPEELARVLDGAFPVPAAH